MTRYVVVAFAFALVIPLAASAVSAQDSPQFWFSVRVSPADPSRTRIVVRPARIGIVTTYDVASFTVDYTPAGLVLTLRDGVMEAAGRSAPIGTMRVRYRDGRFLGMDAGPAPTE